MRLLYLDIDTLRPDHLGCYGYQRCTSPNIDSVAESGIRFEQMYVSDSPCLPSRTALLTGQFGIRNGVVNHGGSRSELYPSGPGRGRQHSLARTSWPNLLRSCGMRTATVSTFGERHSAFHWYAGFNEVFNLGTDGMETAEMVERQAQEWLARHGREDGWFLHVHFWDPHGPYRTPTSFGDPFTDQPGPQWIDEVVVDRHRHMAGPHSAMEVNGFGPRSDLAGYPRQRNEVGSTRDVLAIYDGYDTGIRYADEHVGRILSTLSDLGIYDDTAVLVSSDHGETLGELGIYCDHQTADLYTHRVPAVLRWPGLEPAVDTKLRYQIDLAATVAELCGAEIPADWDGRSFASGLAGQEDPGREQLILSCGAWTVQRAVRFGPWLCIWSYHDGFHGFPAVMLFDVESDPHEQVDLAETHPATVAEASRILTDWVAKAMRRAGRGEDPLWTVVSEGGGLYVRERLEEYAQRLKLTGRNELADLLLAREVPVGRL